MADAGGLQLVHKFYFRTHSMNMPCFIMFYNNSWGIAEILDKNFLVKNKGRIKKLYKK